MSRTFKTAIAAIVLTAGFTLASPVQAGGYCHAPAPPQYSYRTITVYETIRKPYIRYVTRYHECGTPYRARVIAWETVRIPVQKTVRQPW